MRETPLYQGAQYREAERPQANMPSISMPENPAARGIARAIDAAVGAFDKYSDLKDYQQSLEEARARKLNEEAFKSEMKRRAQLPWGSTDSVYFTDGRLNRDAVASLVVQYQEKNLATRGRYWKRQNNIRADESLKLENEMLSVDAFELLGRQEMQNMREVFNDTLELAEATNSFDEARAVVSSGVLQGLITPQKAERLNVRLDERQHEFGQKNIMQGVLTLVADGDKDEVTRRFLKGDYNGLDADKQVQIRRIINSDIGRVRHKTTTDSKGRTKTEKLAPDGLPDYMVQDFNMVQQMGGVVPVSQQTRMQENFMRWAKDYITDPDSAAQLETVRRVGKEYKYSDKFVSAAIDSSLQEFGGTAKFNVSDYVKSYDSTYAPLLSFSQRQELEQARKVYADLVELKKAGSLDDDDKAMMESARDTVKKLEMQHAKNLGKLDAAVRHSQYEVENKNKDARAGERITAANHATYRILSEVTGNKNPNSIIPTLKEWQQRSAKARNREAAEETEREANAAAGGRKTVEREAARPQKVESFRMPQSIDEPGSEGDRKALLFVPRGSALKGRSIRVVHPTAKGDYSTEVEAVEAEVGVPTLSFRAHVRLKNDEQTSLRLSIVGDDAVLTEGSPEEYEHQEENATIIEEQAYTRDDGLLPENKLFPEVQQGEEDEEAVPMAQWVAPEGELGL